MDMWSVFSTVVWNIMERSDVADKRTAVNTAVDEFKNVLTAKAMVAFSVTAVEAPEPHELKSAIDALLANIDNSLVMDADLNGKLATINPTLQELGNSILQYITAKSQVVESPVPTENKNNDTLLAELKSLVQPISDALASLQGEVGLLKSQTNAQSVQSKSRIPQPRTFASSIYKSQEVETPKPGSLRAIVNKSVGL
jgi:transglutaminase/protease-like cytokinesis protein 3